MKDRRIKERRSFSGAPHDPENRKTIIKAGRRNPNKKLLPGQIIFVGDLRNKVSFWRKAWIGGKK